MAEKSWKRFEREVAEFFGTRRVPVGEDNQRRAGIGDVELAGFYVQCRLREKGSAEAWLRETEKKARAVTRRPVVVFRRARRPGTMVLCYLEDLDFLAAMASQARLQQWDSSNEQRSGSNSVAEPARGRCGQREEPSPEPAAERGRR